MSKYTLLITDDSGAKSHLAIFESDTPFGSISIGDTLRGSTVDDGSHAYQVVEIRHSIAPKIGTQELSCHEVSLLVELFHIE